MRITVDLPPELVRAIRLRVAQDGETLQKFFDRALIHELRRMEADAPTERVTLPLIHSRSAGTKAISNTDIEAIFADEEHEKFTGR